MASSSHDLPATSCQETLNLICHEKTNSGCHSKSFSALPCSGPGGPERKPEIHKSLNSILCVSKCNEKSILQSHSSEWSPIQDAVPDLCPVKADCNHLSVDYVQQRIQHRNHYRSADSSLATAAEQEVTRNFVRCNVSENISLLGHSETAVCTAEGVDNLDTTSMMVQKSYSDYFCGSRTSVPSSVREHNKNSAIYSNLSSSSSISGSGSDGTCTLSNVTQDSGIVYSPSTVQNNLTDVMSPVREQSIPLCHLDSSTIQHNITVYTVPGTYQHGVLGPRNSGNGFPNNGHMYSQSHYSIPGVMSCDNISDTKLLPPAMIIHNSCSMHCCKGHEPMMKVDDTIAAYCHSLPIPSVQFSSGLVHSLDKPVSGHIPPEFCYQLQPSDKFAIPKLVSSVSESGLDAKKLIKCGRLAFPQSPVSTGELHLNTSLQGNNDLLLKTSRDDLEIPDSGAKMKDNWTMTSMNYLSMEHKIPLNCKDAEVQTIIIMENKAVSTSPCPQTMGHSHLFPEVGLGLNLQCPQTPIREVRWDNEGMTWEVYGAAVDPEVLGSAIQKHLEIQIEQHLQPSELSEEMEQSTKEKRRSLRTVMQSLRQSNCCVRTNSTSE